MIETTQERWVYHWMHGNQPKYRISPFSPEQEQAPGNTDECLGHYAGLTDMHVRDLFYLAHDHKGPKETFLSELEKIVGMKEKPILRFDPDLSPENPYNEAVAEARRLSYDSGSKCYRDSDGSPVADEFGQPLG
jgi:hypothetical protein